MRRTAVKKIFGGVATNHELAKKYSINPRTVTNWRNEGCPFDDGQWAVLDWLARRRYAPVGANAKFAKQLSERKARALCATIPRAREASGLARALRVAPPPG